MVNNLTLVTELTGILFLLDFFSYLPFGWTCFGRPFWPTQAFHGRVGVTIIFILWAIASYAMIANFYVLPFSIVFFLALRHLCIKHRWSSLFRGGGAPGFMSHFIMMYLSFLYLAQALDASGRLSRDVSTLLRVDFAFIVICSGTYKAISGYWRGDGLEYCLANPWWSYAFNFFKKLSPRFFFFPLQDKIAALAQIGVGICVLIPPLNAVGGVICLLMFTYLLFVLRLGRLAGLMMTVALFFLPDFGLSLFNGIFTPKYLAPFDFTGRSALNNFLHALIWATIAIIPLIKITQYLNLLWNRKLPEPFQSFFIWAGNFIPVIIWRVFTADIGNFFIRIYRREADGSEIPLVHESNIYSYRNWQNFWLKMRFLHVAESAAIATVFTTLKYFKSDRALFEQRLILYARSLPSAGREKFRFEYVSVIKGEKCFEHIALTEFLVDVVRGTVQERVINKNIDYSQKSLYSPIKEARGFGTYLSKGETK